MKINKLTFLLLSIISASAFAGNYADKGDVPENNKDDGSHFYFEVGAAEYYFDQPGMTLPMSTGLSGPSFSAPWSTTPGENYTEDAWGFNPSITLGYQFLTDNAALQKVFGQQNALELRASYFHSSGSQANDYGDKYYINNFPITGGTPAFGQDGSMALTNSTMEADNTYESIGLYYTGNKLIDNQLINSPYVGIDVAYLKQDIDYTTTEYELGQNISADGDSFEGNGSDDLSSYYAGLAFGDKATYLFENHYGAYGKAGAGVYWMHTKLDASQIINTNNEAHLNELMKTNLTSSLTDDQFTFKLNAELGMNYYFKNNQDPMSPYVTVLVGVDYWNDVAYADNPTQANQSVQIAYDHSLNPYAGLQFHMPL